MVPVCEVKKIMSCPKITGGKILSVKILNLRTKNLNFFYVPQKYWLGNILLRFVILVSKYMYHSVQR